MSNLRLGTISNIAGTGSPVITGGELSRARFNLNGTGTIALRDSYNIASMIDNGVGDYTANFSTAFPAIGYTPVSATWGSAMGGQSGTAPTVSAFRAVVNTSSTASPFDPDYVFFAFFGDIP